MINYTKLFNYDLFSISQKNKNKIFSKILKYYINITIKIVKNLDLYQSHYSKIKRLKKLKIYPIFM